MTATAGPILADLGASCDLPLLKRAVKDCGSSLNPSPNVLIVFSSSEPSMFHGRIWTATLASGCRKLVTIS